MNMAADDDAMRHIRIVRAPEPPPPKSPGAEAAARYRARKRGENVPKRNPGPKPATVLVLRRQIGDLEAQASARELKLRLLTEQLRRQVSTLTIERAAEDLLRVLARDDPRRDSTERQELLGDVLAAIESRHERWPR